MVIAALLSFGILLVAWMLAPSEPTAELRLVADEPEALPIAA